MGLLGFFILFFTGIHGDRPLRASNYNIKKTSENHNPVVAPLETIEKTTGCIEKQQEHNETRFDYLSAAPILTRTLLSSAKLIEINLSGNNILQLISSVTS